MEVISHPDVEIFWNFFPFVWVIWWPVKAVMNVTFFYLWIPAFPFYEIWNFFWYAGLIFLYFLSFLTVCGTAEVLLLDVLLWTFLTYLYSTALPDVLTFSVLGSITAGIWTGITGIITIIMAYEGCYVNKTSGAESCLSTFGPTGATASTFSSNP